MANRILTLTTQNKDTESLEKYIDISLVSEYSPVSYKSLIKLDQSSDSTDVGALSSEVHTQQIESEEIALIVDDPSNSQDQDRKLIFQTSFVGNYEAYAYNKVQNAKAKYKLSKNVNVRAIQQSLHNIFTWIQGERILNPEFGCRLREYLYEGITDYNKEQIMAEIRHCIIEWEPRVSLVKVVDMSSVGDTEDNMVVIDIVYAIPSLSDEQYRYSFKYKKTL